MLGASLMRRFAEKAREFETPNRVYCHINTCSVFLGPATDNQVSTPCQACWARTCTRCKNAAHGTLPCDDQLDQEVLALGESEGWRRCPACHQLIELSMGCFHMTCRCRKEFCYRCGETWKRCACPQWEEPRLYAAAEDRVRRQMPAINGGAGPATRGAGAQAIFRNLVRQEADRLRTNHDCDHGRWSRIQGRRQCEHCNDWLREFLWVSSL
jgi:hypothetical protein